jgi:hypothetical protein
MRASTFTLLFLVSFAIVTAIGGWLWTRHDVRKRNTAGTDQKPGR